MTAMTAIDRDPRDIALRLASDRLKGALGSIQHGLRELRETDDPAGLVDDIATILRRRLGPTERGWLLITAAQAANPADLEALAVAVVEGTRRGAPVPAFDDVRSEARLWASWAGLPELRMYMAAIWRGLPERDRTGFLKANRKVVA